MQISSNLTVELFNQPFLLEKRIELLFALEEKGSISQAAKTVPMSYKTAWEAIDNMNNLSPTPIVIKETGGLHGGGTKLTQYGKNLLRTYSVIRKEQESFLKHLQKRTNIDTGTIKTLGRFSMQLSARNQIQGTIQQIRKDSVKAELFLRLRNGNTLISTITNTSLADMNLKINDEVTAIFKSSSVTLTTENRFEAYHKNHFLGTIKEINNSEINAEIILDIGQGKSLVSIIPIDIVEEMELEINTKATALICPSDVIIGQ